METPVSQGEFSIELPALEYTVIDWMDSALCALLPSIDFFNYEHQAQAKSTCKQCPVASDCLEFANQNRIKDGVWGGLTYKERRILS